MKKTITIFSAVVLCVIILFFCLYFALTTPKFTGDFSVNEFQEEMENINFQTEINYGKIGDYKSAASAGKKAIAERFDNSNGGIFKWMGCSVQYDAENDAYYIRTYHLAPRMMGGAYDVIIKADGTVLAIWGEK